MVRGQGQPLACKRKRLIFAGLGREGGGVKERAHGTRWVRPDWEVRTRWVRSQGTSKCSSWAKERGKDTIGLDWAKQNGVCKFARQTRRLRVSWGRQATIPTAGWASVVGLPDRHHLTSHFLLSCYFTYLRPTRRATGLVRPNLQRGEAALGTKNRPRPRPRPHGQPPSHAPPNPAGLGSPKPKQRGRRRCRRPGGMAEVEGGWKLNEQNSRRAATKGSSDVI